MRGYALATAAAAALFAGSVSQAAVQISSSIVRGVDFGAPAFLGIPAETSVLNTPGAGWVGVKLTATADAGQVIKGFDFSAGTGITAPMLQKWVDGDFSGTFTPSEKTPTGSSTTIGDSVLLVGPNAEVTSVSEDNPGTGTTIAQTNGNEFYGIGSFLKGAWGVGLVADYTAVTDFAYIVLKVTGSPVAINIAGAAGQGVAGNDVSSPSTINAQVTVNPVPEPASMSLLALGRDGPAGSPPSGLMRQLQRLKSK